MTTEKKSKKKAVVFICVALIIGVISGVLLLVLNNFEKDTDSDNGPHYNFYKPDYELDVTKVKEYMELDRLLYYRDGGVEVGLDGNADKIDRFAVFFEDYFAALTAGDVDAYREMFSKNYTERNGEEDGFAPQMVYDIHVARLRGATDDENERIAFDVSYRIYRNDGTLRDDVGSDASRTLYFELAYDEGELKIDRIAYYK